jgi:hypothetical protein
VQAAEKLAGIIFNLQKGRGAELAIKSISSKKGNASLQGSTVL